MPNRHRLQEKENRKSLISRQFQDVKENDYLLRISILFLPSRCHMSISDLKLVRVVLGFQHGNALLAPR